MMLKKLLSICARPGYKIPKNVLKIYLEILQKCLFNPNFAYKNLAIHSRNPDLPQFFSEIMT